MIFVLDASAAESFLFAREGGDIVRACLLEDEGTAYIHRQNLIEIFYVAHRRGALAAFLARHPERQNATEPDKPNLEGVDFLDAAVFDEAAGDVAADLALENLQNAGVRVIESDANLWRDAAKLKSRFRRVSLADCFGVALARRFDAEFVTADRHELEALEAAGVADFTFIR